jgi:Fe-S-cluster containining protein
MDELILNREIAYQGALGKYRENLCINYTNFKKTTIRDIEETIIKKALAEGKTISCHKGCSFCCSQYVGVSLEEAETIVHYLYKHEEPFRHFIENYPIWRKEVGKNEPLFQNLSKIHIQALSNPKNNAALSKAAELYLEQNISCPFLDDKLCSIYEVRPWGCAIGMSTSPTEYCIGANGNRSVMIIVEPWNRVQTVSFYNELHNDVYLPLPIFVNGILHGGTNYLSNVPGLENIHREHISDPIVQSTIRKYVDF